jgi:hypothetical protein
MRVCASSLNYRDLMVLKGGGRGPTKIGVDVVDDANGCGLDFGNLTKYTLMSGRVQSVPSWRYRDGYCFCDFILHREDVG